MSRSLNPTEVFQRLLDGISAGRWHELAGLYADDAVVEMPTDPQRTRLVGREAVRQPFAAAASGSFALRAHRVIVHATTDPEVVIAEFDDGGLHRPTGATFTVANVQLLRVRDGQIVASRDYYHDHRAFAAARVAEGA